MQTVEDCVRLEPTAGGQLLTDFCSSALQSIHQTCTAHTTVCPHGKQDPYQANWAGVWGLQNAC